MDTIKLDDYLKKHFIERAEREVAFQRVVRICYLSIQEQLLEIETKMEAVRSPNLQDVRINNSVTRENYLLNYIEEKEYYNKLLVQCKKQILKFEHILESFDQEEKEIIYSSMNIKRINEKSVLREEIVAKEEKARQTLQKLGQNLF